MDLTQLEYVPSYICKKYISKDLYSAWFESKDLNAHTRISLNHCTIYYKSMLRRVAKPSIWLIINQEDNNLEFFPLKHIVCTKFIGKINYLL